VKRSNRLVILVGVLLAVLAFVGIVVLLGQTGSKTDEPKRTVTVLIAKSDIAIGDSVTPDMVSTKEVDPEAVSGNRIADPSQLTGSPALFPVSAGQQVSKEAVGIGGLANYCITACLEAGEKAIAFQVERVTGLDFLIQPGDHIDILFRGEVQVLQPTIDSNPENPRFEPITGLENGEADEVTVRADDMEFGARVRLETPKEREYLRHGGILPYVLRRLLAS